MTQNYLKYVHNHWSSFPEHGSVTTEAVLYALDRFPLYKLYTNSILRYFCRISQSFFPTCPPTRHSCPLHWERRIISRFVRLFPRYLILFWIYSRSHAGRALNPSYWIMDSQGGEKSMTCWKCWVLSIVCRIVCPDLCTTSFWIQPPSYIYMLGWAVYTLRSILAFYQGDKPHWVPVWEAKLQFSGPLLFFWQD